ncbi:DUF6236 family protein [Streptomyces sp. NPDC126933]|uniref:DUF6236 family protein n=1 Tax=unclassified Streptomyces TaxID=2593676 RepID=UPI00364629D7
MPTLLYYPLVSPPQEILHQALLYWDGIASVVPESRDVYEDAVSDELKDLRDRGLYHPVTLGPQHTRLLGGPGHRPRGESYEVLIEELRELAAGAQRPRLSFLDAAFLYRSKVGYLLEDEIVRLGLGQRLDGAGRRSMAVPKEVQLLLIGALARELAAETTARAYTPYTDQRFAHETSLRLPALGDGTAAWRVELGRLLPVPAPGTPTSEVLEFRNRYDGERQRLIDATQTMLVDLRRNWEHPADVLQRMRVELTQAHKDYESVTRSSRMAWVSRSISVTVGVAAAAAGALIVPHLGWLAGVAGSIAFNVATREVRPLSQAKKEHPFSYLHHVDRELA